MPRPVRAMTVAHLARLNRAVLDLGAPPVVLAAMRTGHRLRVDLRSHSEWAAYYTGEFDDRRIAAARVLMRGSGFVAVDAGANVGFWTLPLAMTGGARQVLSFEPIPRNAARLRENVELNGVVGAVAVLEVALSDRRTELVMTMREDFESGAATGNAAVLIDDGTDHRFETLEVPTRTLDEVLDRRGRPPVDIIKADLEGHEDRFLAGSERTIAADRPVIFIEWNRIYYERRGVDPVAATTAMIRRWDYRCLRREGDCWLASRDFHSSRPLDDMVLAPAERVRHVEAVLRATEAS